MIAGVAPKLDFGGRASVRQSEFSVAILKVNAVGHRVFPLHEGEETEER
jgi:hypothetical protein